MATYSGQIGSTPEEMLRQLGYTDPTQVADILRLYSRISDPPSYYGDSYPRSHEGTPEEVMQNIWNNYMSGTITSQFKPISSATTTSSSTLITPQNTTQNPPPNVKLAGTTYTIDPTTGDGIYHLADGGMVVIPAAGINSYNELNINGTTPGSTPITTSTNPPATLPESTPTPNTSSPTGYTGTWKAPAGTVLTHIDGSTVTANGSDSYDMSRYQAPAGTDFANPNSTTPTGGTTGATAGINTAGGNTGGAGTSSANVTDSLTPSELAQYNQLPQEIQVLFKTADDFLRYLISTGNSINPNITIDDATVASFLTQAQKEYKDYFRGEQSVLLNNFVQSMNRTSQLLGQQEEDLARNFKQDYRTVGETAANQGITFSGERLRTEQELTDAANRTLGRNRQDTLYNAQRSALEATRNLGTAALAGQTVPRLPGMPSFYNTGEIQYSSGLSQPLATVPTGISGLLPRQQEVAEQTRAAQLEELYRERLPLSTS